MANYQIAIFLNNKMVHGEGNTYQEALMDLVETSIIFNGNWSPQKRWWQFWKKKYPLWVLEAFRDWKINALRDVIEDLNPEDGVFYETCKKNFKNNDFYQWR